MPADEPSRPWADDDEPDPTLLWRWVGARRPALARLDPDRRRRPADAPRLLRRVPRGPPGKQIPYLVSGGIGGMFLAVLGAYFLGTQELRRDSGRLDRLERMVEELHQRAAAPPRRAGRRRRRPPTARRPTARGARRPAGSSSSRAASCSTGPTCPLVDGKDARRADAPRRPASGACDRARPARPAPARAAPDRPPMFYVQIALLGIIFGCLYALSATGIVLTYTATGVFNIAHFAVALLAGYLGWQLSGVWGLPADPGRAGRAARVRAAARSRARAGRVPTAPGATGVELGEARRRARRHRGAPRRSST